MLFYLSAFPNLDVSGSEASLLSEAVVLRAGIVVTSWARVRSLRSLNARSSADSNSRGLLLGAVVFDIWGVLIRRRVVAAELINIFRLRPHRPLNVSRRIGGVPLATPSWCSECFRTGLGLGWLSWTCRDCSFLPFQT